jgi:hypothetical protein
MISSVAIIATKNMEDMKKMKKGYGKAASLLALLTVGFFLSTAASAYRGDYSVQGPNCVGERHELMHEARENMDYDAWYALMTSEGKHPRVVDVVNKENFNLSSKHMKPAKTTWKLHQP